MASKRELERTFKRAIREFVSNGGSLTDGQFLASHVRRKHNKQTKTYTLEPVQGNLCGCAVTALCHTSGELKSYKKSLDDELILNAKNILNVTSDDITSFIAGFDDDYLPAHIGDDKCYEVGREVRQWAVKLGYLQQD